MMEAWEWRAEMRKLIAYLSEQIACSSSCDEGESLLRMKQAVQEGLEQFDVS